MFYNRIARQFPIESRRTYIRPSFSHPMSYGPMTYGHEFNRDVRVMDRDIRHMDRDTRHMDRELRLMDRDIHRANPTWDWNHGVHTCSAPADVLELDEQFIIEVALPGVVLDDIQLKIEENVLSITAKRTPTLFEERATVLKKELPSVYLLRQFEFDTEIISEQIEARLDRGILYISIPKVEVALRVPVSAGIIESHLPNTTKTRVSSKHEVNVK